MTQVVKVQILKPAFFTAGSQKRFLQLPQCNGVPFWETNT